MYSCYQDFKTFLDKKEIKFMKHKFKGLFGKYSFLYLQNEVDIDQIFSQKINPSPFAVLDTNNNYFVFCFENQVIIIEQEKQSLLKQLYSKLSEFNKEIYFLSDSQAEIQKIMNNDFKEHRNSINIDNFYSDIKSFKENFKISTKSRETIKSYWNLIKSCLAGYLIIKGYMKCVHKDRNFNFLYNYPNNKQEIIFEENDFVFLRHLKTTGSSMVYLSYHIEKEILCIIKFPYQDLAGKLANREIDNYKIIDYPYIPKFYGIINNSNNQKYLVIEYIFGRTLQNIKELNLEFGQKIDLISEILYIFEYLHVNHLIYRDLKPNNFMIDQNNQIILIDFDRLINEKVVETNNPESFTHYFDFTFAAPEICMEGINPSIKSDIYSIGMIIYYLIMEEYPDNLNENERLHLDFKNKYPDLYDIFCKCTEKDIDKRPSISELITYFENYKARKNIVDLCENAKNYEYINYMILHSKFPKYFFKLALAAINDNDAAAQYCLGVDLLKADIKHAIHFLTLSADQNNCYAQFSLGLLYYHGDYVSIDLELAFHYFSLSAKQNYGPALNYLGNFYINDDYLPQNSNKAFYYYSLAADQNDANALANLGFFYYEGKYLKQDIQKSIHFLTLAANQNHIDSQKLLGIKYKENKHFECASQKSIYYFTLAANQNDADSLYFLGSIYYNGEIVQRNVEKAIHYYELAAKNNHSRALKDLGAIYLNGICVPSDNKKAIHYMECAAYHNNLEAQFLLGKLYYDGNYVQRDIQKSIFYYTLAANQNHREAQFCLGYIFAENIYVPRDIKKSVHYYTLAANQNHPIAQNNLGSIYLLGQNIQRDIEKAIFYFQLAGNQHQSNAYLNLAYIYYSNKYVTRDIKKVIYYYTQAANLNNPMAQFELGQIFFNGEYVPRDINKAIHYYTMAANQNYAIACNNLGFIYFEGKYVHCDIEKAIHYYKIAANQNIPEPLNNLGIIYILGKHVKRDIEKAIHYFKLAANLNMKISQKTLGLIYYEGFHVPIDMNKAVHYFLLASRQNEPMSQFYLGKIFYYGESVPKDIKRALEYLNQSAENMYRDAQLFLAHVYLEGKYVNRDMFKAFHLYKEVSSFYNNFAKNNLGVIIKNGCKDIKKNIALAKEYFNEAIKQKNDPLSMYNLSNILLDERNSDPNLKSPIELLVLSASQMFYPSIILLCHVLKSEHGSINIEIFKNEFKKYNHENEKIAEFIYFRFELFKSNILYADTYEYLYKVFRKNDFLYGTNGVIAFQKLDEIQQYEEMDSKQNYKNINEEFYNGLGNLNI
ncbi:hypothetical protein M9Y10_040188 [Tritrichomonas musculus]|uniref:Protein kinase domain-containing protein n=1 Tax=Tritrichomonas musculus TaxID=1915356 RepID=A0ABR2GQ31_9EUKA